MVLKILEKHCQILFISSLIKLLPIICLTGRYSVMITSLSYSRINYYSYRSETAGFFIAVHAILKIIVSIAVVNIIDAANTSVPNFNSTK